MSKVEEAFLQKSPFPHFRVSDSEFLDSILVASFPELGKLTALRFIEFIQSKPDAVVSLPTGKTPEYFIKWVQRILRDWDGVEIQKLRREAGLACLEKPSMDKVRFVQMDEFCPISPSQSNSYSHYIERFYVEGFGLVKENCLLIDTSEVTRKYMDVFDEEIDLAHQHDGRIQKLLQELDEYCQEYEAKIARMDGIDLFIGGIGPDGHIAFNIRGSAHDSKTRILKLNYESLASSGAEAMGGMLAARKKLVVTIGLGTICLNPNCCAIIFASGDAKAAVVSDSIDSLSSPSVPSHALRRLANSKFYLTLGSAKNLRSRRSVLRADEPLDRFLEGGLPSLPQSAADSLAEKFQLGQRYMRESQSVKTLHTEPHHDDIMLGYLPLILSSRSSVRECDTFACGTSGFNSVSNNFLIHLIELAESYLDGLDGGADDLKMFEQGVAGVSGMVDAALAKRFLDNLEKCGWTQQSSLKDSLRSLREYILSLYPGQKQNVRAEIFHLKSFCREFEAECLWTLLGWTRKDVRHLRLGFYTSDVFAPDLEFPRDVAPILTLLNELKPAVVTVALDPESSGPDTHYKMLQAVTCALNEYCEQSGGDVRILGYRNVWYRFDLAEATMIVPVTKDEMAQVDSLFRICYQTQKSAEFPSYQLDGPFSQIVINTWREQLEVFKKCMPQFPLPDSTAGLVFIKEMSLEELKHYSRSLRQQVQ